MNYFELFQIPVRPKVDQSILSERYFALQRRSHPDFFQHATDAEREEAMMQSAEVNKAYSIFRDANKTIAYYLKEAGQMEEGEQYPLSNDFLMDMMEINDELEELDGEIVRAKVESYEKELYQEVAQSIESEIDLSREEQKLLKDYYYKKKYLERILERLVD